MATLFKKIDYTLDGLLHAVDLGEIGLPEIQRPFVWNAIRVRDLFDSMYQGFPVGYLLFWANDEMSAVTRQIGVDGKQRKVPRLLVVDGQQRLTSLYAVVRGLAVLNADWEEQRINIAFNPREGSFEVATAISGRDPEFIPDVSTLWTTEGGTYKVINEFIAELSKTRELSDEEKESVAANIARAAELKSYPFTALEIESSVDEEKVADIFVRINSEGVKLNQADFILTLLSVWWDKGRADLEAFSRAASKPTPGASPFNHHLQPAPEQLLRVSVAVGFRRGQLRSVYQVLRGKDPATKQISLDEREHQFERLRKAQAEVLDLTNWHEFLKCLTLAGYRSGQIISSENAVLYTYALYLIGRKDYGLDPERLRRLIARWFYMASLTGRYTNSPETAIEQDLARLRPVTNADEFEAVMNEVIEARLTSDFWSITLPNDLATSASRAPGIFGFYAALNVLAAPVLFSRMRVPELFDPAVRGARQSIERHHLFPKAYLKKNGVELTSQVNQIANFALVEWGDNGAITDRGPTDYFPEYAAKFSSEELTLMMRLHALPEGWEHLDYQSFLVERRKLIAQVIKQGYERLTNPAASNGSPPKASVEEILRRGEDDKTEFKSTARYNLHTQQRDERLEHSIIKSIAAFANSDGGTLIIGVDDAAQPLGLANDYGLIGKGDRDGFALWLTDLLEHTIGRSAATNLSISFHEIDGHEICRVEVPPSPRPVFVNPAKGENTDEFFVRISASTRKLLTNEVLKYTADRWGTNGG
jgi:hypothetical protein